MNHTRRDLGIYVSALIAAASAEAKQTPVRTMLSSKSYEFAEIPVKVNEKNHNESRQVFDGLTHESFPIDLHITTLAPGQMPHAAHHHEYEELIFIQTGNLEINIKGQIAHVGPGSVVYVASNDEHGWRNVGDVPSQYFVLALGHRGGA